MDIDEKLETVKWFPVDHLFYEDQYNATVKWNGKTSAVSLESGEYFSSDLS